VFARFDLGTVADAVSLTVAAAVGVVAFLVLGAVFAVTGYLVSNWGFSLTLDPQGRTFHVRRGLVTTTETSLERERVRGVELGEPFGLRLAGAARMAAIVTGVSRSERGSNQIVPPAPLGVVTDVGARVLADEGPLQVALRQHGPAARRRRWTRALLSAALVPATVALLCAWTALPWWVLGLACLLLVPAAWVAEDRYRRLGHALTPGHLVARSGTFRGRRDMLQRGGIIGWNIQQSWFQRRAGLATLVATTAAGQQAYAVPDLPEHEAVALADAAVPGLVAQFMAR
jgi:putative membrane protein